MGTARGTVSPPSIDLPHELSRENLNKVHIVHIFYIKIPNIEHLCDDDDLSLLQPKAFFTSELI